MEWSDIGGFIGKAAPLLGSVLTGNIPGAIASAGTLIASAFGCEPTPDAIHQAILQSPDAAVKLAQIEATNRTELERIASAERTAERQADSSDLQTVNETIREEGKSEHFLQWSWRPLNGYALAIGSLSSVFMCSALAFVAVFGQKPEAVNAVPTLAAAFATILAIPGAVCGVTAWHRGKAQRQQVAR